MIDAPNVDTGPDKSDIKITDTNAEEILNQINQLER
jgi:hypothetical protein